MVLLAIAVCLLWRAGMPACKLLPAMSRMLALLSAGEMLLHLELTRKGSWAASAYKHTLISSPIWWVHVYGNIWHKKLLLFAFR